MSSHSSPFQGDICAAIQTAIAEKIPDAKIEVEGGDGHYRIKVVSPSFAGQSTLQRQRGVYGAIAHLMQGAAPPVHAVDNLRTLEE